MTLPAAECVSRLRRELVECPVPLTAPNSGRVSRWNSSSDPWPRSLADPSRVTDHERLATEVIVPAERSGRGHLRIFVACAKGAGSAAAHVRAMLGARRGRVALRHLLVTRHRWTVYRADAAVAQSVAEGTHMVADEISSSIPSRLDRRDQIFEHPLRLITEHHPQRRHRTHQPVNLTRPGTQPTVRRRPRAPVSYASPDDRPADASVPHRPAGQVSTGRRRSAPSSPSASSPAWRTISSVRR